MVIKKIQIRPKGNGTYSDILYPETSAAQVYCGDGETLQNKLPTLLKTSDRGAADGVAPLGTNSKIPTGYLPIETNIEPRTSDPATPATGRMWLRTDL